MMAKALAHESGACFINLHISTLTEKWYGDSNKLVSAVFSLARKLQPAIVFIDEIDAVLGTRRTGEHEASGMVKAEYVSPPVIAISHNFTPFEVYKHAFTPEPRFMTHWDGLASSHAGTTQPQRILILGATNRIQDIDEAILRRMPKKFPVGLPNASQRKKIFSLILRGTKIDHDNFDLDYLVRVSAGMSGSDIKEACRDAAMAPVREYIRAKRSQASSGAARSAGGMQAQDVRGLQTDDFFGRGRAAKELSALDDVDDEVVNVKGGSSRKIHTLDSSAEDDEESSEGTQSGEERFRDAENVRR
jgi:SpoVK/Ycf46/Vps4 family AAA+-type ATPase